jgi:hypothetical protein
MPLNASGPLSLGGSTVGQSVNLELGKSATALISMNDTDLRTLFGVASGQISMSQGYGKSSFSSNATRGFFAGGSNSPLAGFRNTMSKLTFSNEAWSSIGAVLAVARSGLTGVNSTTRGYYGGGPLNSNEIDGIQFSNETAINPAATLAQGRTPEGTQSTTRGYFVGGSYNTTIPGPSTQTNEIDGIQFSDETAINPAATLVQARINHATVNSSTRGYFGGGTLFPAPGYLENEIDGFIFSSETSINPAATLVQGRTGLSGVSSTTRGYFGGGEPSGPVRITTEIDGIEFSSETSINPAAALAQARHGLVGVSSSTRGYFLGGDSQRPVSDSDTIRSEEIDGILFSNETAINPAATITGGLTSGASTQDSNN